MTQKDIDYSQESILIVDDDSHLRETLQGLVGTLGFNTGVAASGLEALETLKGLEYSFLLTDMKMPQMDGLELIKNVQKAYPEMSMVAMTGYSEGYKYVDVINAGASDFIKKPFDLEELEAKLRRIITERNLRKELSRLSITDSLTGLYNQRQFYTRMNEEVLRANRQKHSLALMLLDLDNFKVFNDTQGHLAGDEVLRETGRIIKQSIRVGVDSGYRYGGDEFAIILIDANSYIAEDIAKRIKESLKEKGDIGASVGRATFSEGMSVKDLVVKADKDLYQSKPHRKERIA
ncbi:MAG: diguanylate cyclase [Pseudomonadota bacterium]